MSFVCFVVSNFPAVSSVSSVVSFLPPMPHQFFDHTGDFGAELTSETRAGLYESAATALVALLTDAVERVEERETLPIAVEGVDAADLLVALGNELLYLFESQRWLAHRVSIEELDGDHLVATAHGEPFDEARHPIARPIKAVTHHGAEIQKTPDGWRGRLIFDL